MQLLKHGKRMSVIVGRSDEVTELLENAIDSVKLYLGNRSGDLTDKEEFECEKQIQHYTQLLKENENIST